MSPGAVCLFMPRPAAPEKGSLPRPSPSTVSPAGDEGPCHVPSPGTELVPAPGLDPLGCPSGDASAHRRFGVLISGISQGHGPMDTTCLSARRPSPPSAPSDPVSTSCRCLGQSMRPGKVFSDAPPPPAKSPLAPPPAHWGLPELQCLLIFLPLLHPIGPQSHIQLHTHHVPVAKGCLFCPGCCAKPTSLGLAEPPGSSGCTYASPGTRQ